MPTQWQDQYTDLSNVNNGNELQNGDDILAQHVNVALENGAYAKKKADTNASDISNLGTRTTNVESRVSNLETRTTNVESRVSTLEAKLTLVNFQPRTNSWVNFTWDIRIFVKKPFISIRYNQNDINYANNLKIEYRSYDDEVIIGDETFTSSNYNNGNLDYYTFSYLAITS